MSYYGQPMGDYKTYGYAGDPGWLSSLWKGIKSVALPIIGGMVGGPMGAAAGTAMTTTKKPKPGTMLMGPGTFGGALTMPGGMSIGGSYQPGVMVPGQGRLPPFTATGAGVLPAGGRGGTLIPTGWHLDKRTGMYLVRNRRMNIANPRALRRAMRRVQGFEKLAKRTIQFTRRVRMKKRKST